MSKQPSMLQVWAIKLNPKLVELRTTHGPLKILVSRSYKGKVFISQPHLFSIYGHALKPDIKSKLIQFRHTQAMNGKIIHIVSLDRLLGWFPGLRFRNDVAKLGPDMAVLVLTKKWRNTYL